MAFFYYLRDAGLDPTVLFGYVTRHGYFPESVVTGSQFLEIPFLVQLVHLTESFFEGNCPVRAVEVPDMDVGDFDCFQGSH
jgi:hypothetical protein